MRIATGIAIGIAVVALIIAAFASLKLMEVSTALQGSGERAEGAADVFVAEVKSLAGDMNAVKGDVAAVKSDVGVISDRLEEAAKPADNEKDAVPHLIPLLKHREPDVRRSVATILKGLRPKSAIEPLVAVSQTDPDMNVRREAFEALTAIGGDGLISFLINSLHSRDEQTRVIAADQMGKVAHEDFFKPLAELFEKSIKEVPPVRRGYSTRIPADLRSVVPALIKVDHDKGLPYLLRAVEKASSDSTIQQTLYNNVRHDDVPTVVEFAQKLPPPDDDDSNYSYSPHYIFMQLFQRLRDERALPYLVSMLGKGHQYLRQRAADSLRYVAGKEAFKPLADALKKAYAADKTPPNQQPSDLTALISALRNLNDSRACTLFVDVIADTKNAYLKRYAAQALYSCHDPAQGDRIYKLWKSETDAQTKSALKNALTSRNDYGYTWDAGTNDFKKRGAQ